MISEASPPAPQALHPIAKFLAEKKIYTVAVIDDAFEDLRTNSELISGEPGRFWERLEFDEEARAALASYGIVIEDEFDVSRDEILQQLWNIREDATVLGSLIRDFLFPAIIEKQTFLLELVKRLKDRLGLTVHTYGKTVDVKEAFKDKEVQLVFLDFIMGPENDIDESVKSSKNIARQIYKLHIGRHMPLVILMSNAGSVYERSAEFRKSSGLLKGMFYVVHKDELASEDMVFLNVGVWSKALPLGTDIQTFINTLQISIKSASIKFMNGIKELSLEDYRYIQRLSLLKDGQPLGDYLIGLYSSYLSHLLFERDAALRAQRKLVDELDAQYPPPGSTMPSMQLIKMYHAALFELEGTGETGYDLGDEDDEGEVSGGEEEEIIEFEGYEANSQEVVAETDIHSVPRSRRARMELPETKQPPQDVSPADSSNGVQGTDRGLIESYNNMSEDELLDLYEHMYRNSGSTFTRVDTSELKRELRLGDLFLLERDRRALLIINADCDLAVRPNATCEPGDSIHLLPGKVQPLRERVIDADEKKKRTELFAFSGESYRIIWEIKKITTLTLANVHSFLEKEGYVWKARLRQPYALELQQTFAADLTRIGMPVPPPIYQPIGVEFLGRVSTSNWVSMMPPTDDLAVVVMKGGKTKCYPTVAFSHKLRKSVGTLIDELERKQQQLRSSAGTRAEIGDLGMQIASLRKFNGTFETWFCGLEELVLPPEAHKMVKVPNIPELGIGWNLTAEDKTDSKSMLLTINITGLQEPPSAKKGSKVDKEPIVLSRTGVAAATPADITAEVDFPDVTNLATENVDTEA